MGMMSNNNGFNAGLGGFLQGFSDMYFPGMRQNEAAQMRRDQLAEQKRATGMMEDYRQQALDLQMQEANRVGQQRAYQHRQDDANAQLMANPGLVDTIGQVGPFQPGQGLTDIPSAEYILAAKSYVSPEQKLKNQMALKALDAQYKRMGREPNFDLFENAETGEQRYMGKGTAVPAGWQRVAANANNIVVNAGTPVDMRPIVDKPAKGYQRVWDPNGSTWKDTLIPGSAADMKVKDAEDKKVASAGHANLQKGVVIEDIGRVLDIVDTADVPVTGMGSWLSVAPGTEAADVSRLLESIKSNVGFDKLQQMRQNSPTGGALGQVSDRENKLLQAALGSLDQSLTKDLFTYNLKRVRDIYLDIIHGPGNWDAQAVMSKGQQRADAPDPLGIR